MPLRASSEQGGGDGFGYRWTDSNQPGPTVAFSWIEIAGSGNWLPLDGDDEAVGPYSIGFNFSYYGVERSEFYVSSNALLTFDGPSWDFVCMRIPNVVEPNDFIAVYWCDLVVNYGGLNSGAVYYETIGTSPNRQLVVEWSGISELGNWSPLTFEIVLNESGEILLQYLVLSGMNGWQASVGIEGPGGSDGTQYSYAEPNLHDKLAVEFSPGLFGFGPDGKMYGEVGWAVPHALRLTNHQSFADSFDIAYSSDLGWATSLYDGSMNLLTDTNGNSIPDTGNVAPGSKFELIVTVEIPVSPQGMETTHLVASSFADPALSDDATVVTALKPAYFVPPHSDFLWDGDSDGLANSLNIEVRFNVSIDTLYVLDSVLYDPHMTRIFGFQSIDHYTPGLCTAHLWFESVPIWLNGVDGPFIVEIGLLDADFVVIEHCTYVTSAYTLDQFDPPSGRFVLPIDEGGVDTDGDGLYNQLVLNATVNVTQAVEFCVYACLYDSQRRPLLEVSLWTYLDVGLQNLPVAFDGRTIFREGEDGPYTYRMVLSDVTSGFFWNDEHENMTAPYTHDQFDPSEVLFRPPHTEYCVDDDGDGMYDYLVVNITIDSDLSGSFYFHSDLRSPTRVLLGEQYAYIDLVVGANTLQVWFDGRAIFDSEEDGPYGLNMVVYDTIEWFLQDDEHELTCAYGYDQFQAPPAYFGSTHSGEAVDVDGDGLFDYVLLNVSVVVLVNGSYEINGWLFDCAHNSYSYSTVTVYLERGNRSVELRCNGFEIYLLGVDGMIGAEIEMYSDYDYLDYDMFDVGVHDTSSFEHVPGEIDSCWASVVPFIDGSYEPSEWADAAVIDLEEADSVNMIDTLLLVKNNETHLFLCYDAVGDGTPSSSDRAAIAFDTLNDENVSQGGEDQFVIGPGTANGQVHYEFDLGAWWWQVDCTPFDDMLEDHEGLSGGYGYGPSDNEPEQHMVYEFSIPLALLGATVDDVLGFFGAGFDVPGVYDGSSMYWSSWPRSSPWTWEFLWFGDLVLAQPPPTTSVYLSGTMGLEEWYVSALTVTLEASGGVGGVNRTMYSLDGGPWQKYTGSFSVSDDGNHLLEFYSVDNRGIEEEINYATFKVDLSPPVTSLAVDGVPGKNGWNLSAVIVNLEASDGSGSGAILRLYRVDGGAWQTYSSAFDVFLPGTHALEYFSVDVAGNEENVVIVAIKIDLAPPSSDCALSGTIGPEDWYATEVTIVISATDVSPGSGVGTISYRLDGGSWQDYAGPIVVTDSCAHTLEYFASDSAGRQEAPNGLSFKIDLEPPSTYCSLSGALGENGWYTTNVVANLTAGETVQGSGVDLTTLKVDGGMWVPYLGELSIVLDGEHTIAFFSVDLVGNEESEESVNFKIDKTPAITIASVSDGIVTLHASDATSGLARTVYRVDGGAWRDYTVPFEVSGKGNHTIEYYSIDNADNSETAKTVWVEIGGGAVLGGSAALALAIAAIVVVAVALYFLLWRKKKSVGEGPGLGPAEPPAQ